MKKLLLLLVFCPVFVFGQIGSLPYQLLRQSYRGDTVYTKLNGDSVNYYTDLGSFRFNKDIYVKGVKLGSGGGSSGVIATQLKNYNKNQDTVIRFPDLASGKFGIWANNNSGSFLNVENNTGSGCVLFRVKKNLGSGNGVFLIDSNRATGFAINEGTTGSVAFRSINSKGLGFSSENINTSTAVGVKSYAADSVSNTSGALTGTFGKTESHLDIDGFGHYRNRQTTPPTITLGSGAGTGATYTLIAGSTDKAGVISVTTGTSPTASGDIFTITYAYPFKGIAVFIAVPANDAASSVQGQARPHMNGYSPTFSGLTASGTALTAGTTYVWHYFVAQ